MALQADRPREQLSKEPVGEPAVLSNRVEIFRELWDAAMLYEHTGLQTGAVTWASVGRGPLATSASILRLGDFAALGGDVPGPQVIDGNDNDVRRTGRGSQAKSQRHSKRSWTQTGESSWLSSISGGVGDKHHGILGRTRAAALAAWRQRCAGKSRHSAKFETGSLWSDTSQVRLQREWPVREVFPRCCSPNYGLRRISRIALVTSCQ